MPPSSTQLPASTSDTGLHEKATRLAVTGWRSRRRHSRRRIFVLLVTRHQARHSVSRAVLITHQGRVYKARGVIASFMRLSFLWPDLLARRCKDPVGSPRGYLRGSNARRLLCRRWHGGRRVRMGRSYAGTSTAACLNWRRDINAASRLLTKGLARSPLDQHLAYAVFRECCCFLCGCLC